MLTGYSDQPYTLSIQQYKSAEGARQPAIIFVQGDQEFDGCAGPGAG